MKFNIKHAPTSQELSKFQKLSLLKYRAYTLMWAVGMLVGFQCARFVSYYYVELAYRESTVLAHFVLAGLYSMGVLSMFSMLVCFVECLKATRLSNELNTYECRALYKCVNISEISEYIKMVNRQGRPITYFDYRLMTKWYAAMRVRQIDQTGHDARVKLHSI